MVNQNLIVCVVGILQFVHDIFTIVLHSVKIAFKISLLKICNSANLHLGDSENIDVLRHT